MATIGIFDSGVGGLSVYREIRKLLPRENYIYFGDNANCPYGVKGTSFIINRSRKITEFLLDKGADIVVVACNTATSYAIKDLRDRFPIPFVGTVPGVKPAAMQTHTGVIGVLATFGTLNAPLYQKIRDFWGSDVEVVEHIGQGFVELVEDLDISSDKAISVVEKSVTPLVERGADVLVLGCTHYPFLKDTIKLVANRIKPISTPSVAVYDSGPAIARQVMHILKDNNLSLEAANPTSEFFSSGSDVVTKRIVSSILG